MFLVFDTRVLDFDSIGFRLTGFSFRLTGFGFRFTGFCFRLTGCNFRLITWHVCEMQAARFLCPFMLCDYLAWVGVTTAKPVYTSDSLYSNWGRVEAVKEWGLALCHSSVSASLCMTDLLPAHALGWGGVGCDTIRQYCKT